MMSALIDDNSIILTDFQHEAIEQLKELIENGNFLNNRTLDNFQLSVNVLDYPHIRFQQDVNYLTKFLYANDWNAVEAVNKIKNSYRLKVSVI